MDDFFLGHPVHMKTILNWNKVSTKAKKSIWYIFHYSFKKTFNIYQYINSLKTCGPDGWTPSPNSSNWLTVGDNVGDDAPHSFCEALLPDGFILKEVEVEVEGAGHGEGEVGHLDHHVQPEGPRLLLQGVAIEGKHSLVNIWDNT